MSISLSFLYVWGLWIPLIQLLISCISYCHPPCLGILGGIPSNCIWFFLSNFPESFSTQPSQPLGAIMLHSDPFFPSSSSFLFKLILASTFEWECDTLFYAWFISLSVVVGHIWEALTYGILPVIDLFDLNSHP